MYEKDCGGHFFVCFNFLWVILSFICIKNDVVSADNDGDDDGKIYDVPANDRVVLSNLLVFINHCRSNFVHLGHSGKQEEIVDAE